MNRSLFSLIVVGFITISNLFVLEPASASPFNSSSLQIAALPGMSRLFQSSAPSTLGIHDGHLSPCPDIPNCVASQNSNAQQEIAPLTYTSDRSQDRDYLLKVLQVVPRTTLITSNENYIRVESASRLLGFVDDVEFYLPEDEKKIEVRSASRLGESDLGVNRRRLEQIRLALKDLGA